MRSFLKVKARLVETHEGEMQMYPFFIVNRDWYEQYWYSPPKEQIARPERGSGKGLIGLLRAGCAAVILPFARSRRKTDRHQPIRNATSEVARL